MKTRAARLIETALASAEVSAQALGQAVGISTVVLNEIRLGEAIMPVAQQLRLARFVIATLPKLRGQAHALEGQALAAASFHAKNVELHTGPPNSWMPNRMKQVRLHGTRPRGMGK